LAQHSHNRNLGYPRIGEVTLARIMLPVRQNSNSAHIVITFVRIGYFLSSQAILTRILVNVSLFIDHDGVAGCSGCENLLVTDWTR
jgi:hypothetical protein